MNKSDLVQLVARKTNVKHDVVDDVVVTFLDTVTRSLLLGEHVSLRGFGKFSDRHRPAVTLKNPQDGTPIEVEPRRTVVFLPSPVLKDRLNEDST